MEAIKSEGLSLWKRFWYGVGGFFATNFLCSIWARLCEAVFYAAEAYAAGVIVIIVGCGIIVWGLYNTFKHQATRNGVIVSVVWQLLILFVMLQGL